MPTRSPEESASTVRELGLPSRAVTALTRAGITDAAVLATLTRQELEAVPGLGAGMIAAVRAVVPEPPATLAPEGPAGRAADPDPVPDDEFPVAPVIPSFASLRGPQRRSAVDLLLSDAPAPQAPPTPPTPPAAPAPQAPPTASAPPAPQDAPAAPGPVPQRPSVPAVRPPDYADLLRLGVHVARTLAVAPARATLWSVGCLRRLVGS